MHIGFINIIKQAVCWVLLLQLINISIHASELKHPKYFPFTNQEQQVAIDEIESIYELVVEGISGDEVPESDEDEADSSIPTIDLYCFNRDFSKLQAVNFPVKHFSHYYNRFLSVHQKPHAPPPKPA